MCVYICIYIITVYEPPAQISYVGQQWKYNVHIIFLRNLFGTIIFIPLASLDLNFICFGVYLPFYQIDKKYYILLDERSNQTKIQEIGCEWTLKGRDYIQKNFFKKVHWR